MRELRRLVAESNARFNRIGEVWNELSDEEQEWLAMQAEATAAQGREEKS
jgi:hypothetical protein